MKMNLFVCCLSIAPLTALLFYLFRKKAVRIALKDNERIDGKVVIITGSNSGIGKETAKELAKRGAKVILACRNIASAKSTCLELQEASNSVDIFPMELDLASFRSIHQFVLEFGQKFSKLDILINNAGSFFNQYSLTEDDIEIIFQTNYLGHFLLTIKLLDKLLASAPSKIINVSSHGHAMCKKIRFDDINGKKNYSRLEAYAHSKLAQIFFTQTLSKKLKGMGVTVNAVTPGNVKTDIYKNFPLVSNPVLAFIQWPIHYFIFKTPEVGAWTSIYCAVSANVEGVTGKYYSNFKETKPSEVTFNTDMEKRLWDLSLELTGMDEVFQEICPVMNEDNSK